MKFHFIYQAIAYTGCQRFSFSHFLEICFIRFPGMWKWWREIESYGSEGVLCFIYWTFMFFNCCLFFFFHFQSSFFLFFCGPLTPFNYLSSKGRKPSTGCLVCQRDRVILESLNRACFWRYFMAWIFFTSGWNLKVSLVYIHREEMNCLDLLFGWYYDCVSPFSYDWISSVIASSNHNLKKKYF